MFDFQELLENQVREKNVVGASFAFWNGSDLIRATVGTLSTEMGFPVTPRSMFQVGSVAKILTAMLILQLVDSGKADIDTPVRDILPEIRTADPVALGEITLRHLLNHTSGLYGDFFSDTGWGDDCLFRLIEQCALLPHIHAPGAHFSYCNIGYNILGRIIEVLTRLTFDEAVRKHILAPLGLHESETLPHRLLGRPAAIGHQYVDDQPTPVETAYFGRCMGPAGGTLTMSASDLLAVLRVLCRYGRTEDGTQIVSEDSVRSMLALERSLPKLTRSGPYQSEVSGWGLGVAHFDWFGGGLVGHDGVTLGQAAFARFDPDSGACAVILFNQTKSPTLVELARAMLDASIGKATDRRMPPTPIVSRSPLEGLERYAGRYRTIGEDCQIGSDEGFLTISDLSSGGNTAPPKRLLHVRDDAFALCDSDGSVLGTALFLFDDPEGPATHIFKAARLVPRWSLDPGKRHRKHK